MDMKSVLVLILVVVPYVACSTYNININSAAAGTHTCPVCREEPKPEPEPEPKDPLYGAENVDFPEIQEWNGLWNIYRVFATIPTTAAAARVAGWTQISSCEDMPDVGEVYAPPPNSPLSQYAIYDSRGQLAGNMDVTSVPLTTVSPWWWEFHGKNVLLSYYTNPFKLCKDTPRRTAVGDRIWIRKARTGKFMNLPLEIPAEDDATWFTGLCFPAMGTHVGYRNLAGFLCDTELPPVFPTYNPATRKLHGYGVFFNNVALPPGLGWETFSMAVTEVNFGVPLPSCILPSAPLTSIHHYFVDPTNPATGTPWCGVPAAANPCPETDPEVLGQTRALAFFQFSNWLRGSADVNDPQAYVDQVLALVTDDLVLDVPSTGVWDGAQTAMEYLILTQPDLSSGWGEVLPRNPNPDNFVFLPPEETLFFSETTYQFRKNFEGEWSERLPTSVVFIMKWERCTTKIKSLRIEFSSDALLASIHSVPPVIELCASIQKRCTGANQQYASVMDCVQKLDKKPLKGCNTTHGWYQGDGVACRFLHSVITSIRPDIHCDHVGEVSEPCAPNVCSAVSKLPITSADILVGLAQQQQG